MSYAEHQDPPDPTTKKITEINEVKRGVSGVPDDRALTAVEALEKNMEEQAVDLAYQGKKQIDIVRQLYCECLTRYPGAEHYDRQHAD